MGMLKLILPLMLGTDIMVVDTDTGMDTTVKKLLECNILPFFKQPPFGAFETYTTALCNITENCVFFYEKNCYKTDIWTHCNQKLSKNATFNNKGPVQATSSVLLSGYDIQLQSEIVILSETVKPK